jgi:hypothetical protein
MARDVSARSKTVRRAIANLLAQAINSDDADRAARIIQEALGIERDDIANYCFPKTWPADREVAVVLLNRSPTSLIVRDTMLWLL